MLTYHLLVVTLSFTAIVYVSAINITLNDCQLNVANNFWLKWNVEEERVIFTVQIKNTSSLRDAWIGFGFSNKPAIPDGNRTDEEVDTIVILGSNGTLTMKVFNSEKGRLLPLNKWNASYEQSSLGKFSENDSSIQQQSISRPLKAVQPFTTDLSACSMWLVYTEPLPLNESIPEPNIQFLLCNVSAICSNESTEGQLFNTTTKSQSRLERQANPSDADLPSMFRPAVSVNSPNFTTVLRQNEQAITIYRDEVCDRPDPYWCQSYVKEYMEWQNKFNRAPKQRVCVQLKNSLLYADNRCCQSVRISGC